MTFRRTAITAAILSIYAVPHVVRAQTNDAEQPDTPQTESAILQLMPIDVDGNRVGGYRAEKMQSPKYTAPLRDTPQSVTVITEEVMRDSAATSLEDAVRQVPGITFLAGEGGQPIADRPVIRGFNSTSNLFVDGVRDIGDQSRDVFDLEAVEVVKGADSVYAGRGSGGGSINLVSKTAKFADFTQGSFTVGTADKFRATVDQNWQLGEAAGFRVGVLAESSGVPGRNDAVEYDKYGISPSLAFGIGEATRVTLDYYHLTDKGTPDYSIPYDLATGLPVTETMDVDSDNFYGLINRDFRETKTDIGTVIVEHEFNDRLRLRNVSRVGQSSNDYVVTNPDDSRGNVEDGFVYRSVKQRASETETFANQLDLSGDFNTGRFAHSFTTGLELSREKRRSDSYNVTSAAAAFGSDCSSTDVDPATGLTFGQLLRNNGDCTSLYDPEPYDDWQGTIERADDPTYYQTDVAAIYGFDTMELNEHWLVSAGLRLDHYETEAHTPSDPGSDVDASDSFVNYQLGLVYKPVEAGSIYLSHGTSTTPAPLAGNDSDAPDAGGQGRRGFTPDNTDLDPEETTSFEIGTKWELFDQRLLVTAAAFHLKRENAYIQTGAGDQDFSYAGETRVRGVEFGVSGRITPRWQVFGGYSYLDSELTEGGFENVAEGEQLPNVPEHSVTLFTNYAVTPTVAVGGGATYVDEVFGSLSSEPPKRVPDYWRFDANASWQVAPSTRLRLNVLNLTDETYYTKAYASHYAAQGPGRQVLLSADFTFE